MDAGTPHSAAWTEWLNRLKLEWSVMAQLAGCNLLPEDQITAFAARLSKVTSHVTDDLGKVVFLGLKMKFKTAAELVVDFVIDTPTAPLPEKLDILQLSERFVDKQFDAYLRDKSIVVSSDDQDAILSAHRKAFEDSHMQAALMSKLSENDVNSLNTQPLFGENNMDCFNNIANGGEKPYFVTSMVNGKPTFEDGVFANFFGAKWFAAGHFVDNATFLAQTFYSPRRTVMRYLFDRILARGCDLHVAVLHDDVAGVRRLLEVEGVDADKRDLAGRIALHMAAARETCPRAVKASSEIIALLLNHTLDIEVEDDLFAGSPLLYADMAKAWHAIDKLLICRADTRHLPSTSTNFTSADMLIVILILDLDSLMAFCLDKGLSVEYEFDGRLLPWACEFGSLRVATLLIARGANINAVDSDHDSPLSAASSNGNLDIVSLLVLNAKLAAHLEASQHVNAYINDNSLGLTALHIAASFGAVKVMSYLIGEGADVWLRAAAFPAKTPLQMAVHSSPKAVALLLAAVDPAKLIEYVNIADLDGNTAMHLAAKFGNLRSAHLLVEAGASVTVRNIMGRTPLIEAAAYVIDRLSIIKYLIETLDGQLQHDYVNAQDAEGKTAMHCAALKGHNDAMELLIGRGALCSILDNAGKTPLDYAGPGQNIMTPASPYAFLSNLVQWFFGWN